MNGTHLLLRLIHIGFGTVVLLLLWIPISTRKGGRSHRRAGSAYLWVGRVVVATALLSCIWALLDPAERIASADLIRDRAGVIADVRFLYSVLGVLGLVALAEMERGVLLAARGSGPRAWRWLTAVAVATGASALALAGWGLVALTTGVAWHGLIRIGVAALGLDVARRALTASRTTTPTGHERQIAHLDAMLGSGAAFYTAFAAFGFGRIFDLEILEGGLVALLPWITPAIVAMAGVKWWKRRLTPSTTRATPASTRRPAVES